MRGALSDFYYNSWRFLGANLAVGLLLVTLLLGAVGSAWALLLTFLLVPPVAGVMRMATCLARDGHTDFGDFKEVIRHPGRVLAIGACQLLIALLLVVDLAIGGAWRSWPGTFLMVSALYGLVLLWTYALLAWPLLLDPERDGEPTRQRLRLALIVLVAHPVRVAAFSLLMGALLLLAGIAIAPIVTFAIAVVWLAIARYVLPLADRVEGRATRVVETAEG